MYIERRIITHMYIHMYATGTMSGGALGFGFGGVRPWGCKFRAAWFSEARRDEH